MSTRRKESNGHKNINTIALTMCYGQTSIQFNYKTTVGFVVARKVNGLNPNPDQSIPLLKSMSRQELANKERARYVYLMELWIGIFLPKFLKHPFSPALHSYSPAHIDLCKTMILNIRLTMPHSFSSITMFSLH